MNTLDFITKFIRIKDDLIDAKAESLGKSRCDLIPWTDYNPIQIESEARSIALGPGIHYAGD
jgi:hypothetical protein